MSNNDQEKLDQQLDETGKKVGKKAGKVAGKAGLKAGKKAGAFAGKLLIKGIASLISAIVSLLSAVLLPVLAIVALVVVVYFVEFEFVGTEKEYTHYHYNDKFEMREDGTRVTSFENMNKANKTVQDFYKYFAGQSYLQIPIDHKEGDELKLLRLDDDGVVEDFYEREKNFKLNENMLYTMDRQLYDNWKYPEQLIKPVYFDEEDLVLLDLVDEEGAVVAESYRRDLKTGEKFKDRNKLKSVRDYGLATVLKFQEGSRNLTVEGTYVEKEVWNGEEVVTEPISEDFEVQLSGFEREVVHVIEKAITFAGEIEYEYEQEKEYYRDLKPGSSEDEGEDVVRFIYDHYTICRTNAKGEVSCTDYPLHKIRDDASCVMEEKPVVVDTEENDKGFDYFEDFVWNFESYIPDDVLTDFNFRGRIDYDSAVFDGEGTITDEHFELGSGIEQQKFKNTFEQWFDLIEHYSVEYGVDPYIILAKITQESGGNPNAGVGGNAVGLGQIAANTTTATATNKDGQKETFNIKLSERTDPEISIKFAVMKFKERMEDYDGNPYKALQSYNFGGPGLNRIKKIDPVAWDTEVDWMIYREAARLASIKGTKYEGRSSASYWCMDFPEGSMPVVPNNLFGDSCYIENVLRYYAGHEIDNVDEDGKTLFERIKEGAKNFVGAIGNLLDKFKRTDTDEFEEDTALKPYIKHSRGTEPDVIIEITNSFENDVLFSESFVGEDIYSELNLFSDGFIGSMAGFHDGEVDVGKVLEMSPNANGFVPPLQDIKRFRISSHFGKRKSPGGIGSTNHKGTDWATPVGTPTVAIADGKVTTSKYSASGGHILIIQHSPGLETWYMHLNERIKVGSNVKQGQVVGATGNTGNSTGPHLHFEIRINGVAVNSLPYIMGGD